MSGHQNPTFISDGLDQNESGSRKKTVVIDEGSSVEMSRDHWGKEIEFLFSCIALSVRVLSLPDLDSSRYFYRFNFRLV